MDESEAIGSVEALVWAWAQPTESVEQKLMLVALASGWPNGNPDWDTVASQCGMSKDLCQAVGWQLVQQQLVEPDTYAVRAPR